jgi:hypothetical protein
MDLPDGENILKDSSIFHHKCFVIWEFYFILFWKFNISENNII